ncbi:MAG: hypothetical protein HC836_10725 [Richelia sp. RM2_1_2]|nr:hypothetical protein [Richelia sp. RM2_1_2]
MTYEFIHLEFRTFNETSCNIMNFLIDEGIDPFMAISSLIIKDGYCIICSGTENIREKIVKLDPIIIKLTTGAELISCIVEKISSTTHKTISIEELK